MPPLIVSSSGLLALTGDLLGRQRLADMPLDRAWTDWNCPVLAFPWTRSDRDSLMIAL